MAQTYLPGCAPEGLEAHEWAPPMDSDTDRRRVAGVVRSAVLEFFRLRQRNAAPEFHMGDLTRYVGTRVVTAPDSAGRIMRALAAAGSLDYELVSRRRSLYRVLAVHEPREGRA